MIKIVLSDHPDKHRVKPSAIKDILHGPPSDFYFYTEITHNGKRPSEAGGTTDDDACWDLDVYVQVGPMRQRVPSLSREVTSADMLYELMLCDNGGATDWIRTLLGQPDVDGIWDRYHDDHPS